MSSRRNLYLLLSGLALIAVGLACGLGSAPEAAAPAMTAPAAEESPPLPQPTQIGVLPGTNSGEGGAQPAILESRRLTLEFPPVMRTGDSSRIRLQLEVDDRGNITPTAILEGNEVTGEVVEIPNLYETHTVIAEARLDMAGMEVQPSGTISEPLSPGQSAIFFWSVRPEESGKYEGAAWLHLRFIPKAGGKESRIAVSVQFLDIEARSLFGFLDGGAARGVGAIGSLLGSVLGFPFFDDFVKWFWRRIKRNNLKN